METDMIHLIHSKTLDRYQYYVFLQSSQYAIDMDLGNSAFFHER